MLGEEKEIAGSDFHKKSVLDIGCNDGLKSLMMNRLGLGRIHGIEIRPDCIERAKFANDFFNSSVQFSIEHESADSKDFAKDLNQYDIVCSFGILYHLIDHRQHILNLRRLAKSKIVMFSSFYSKTGKMESEDASIPYRSYTGKRIVPSKEDILNLLKECGFKNIRQLKYTKDMANIDFTKNCLYLTAEVA